MVVDEIAPTMSIWKERMKSRRNRESGLELIEVCWRVVGPSGTPMACGIYRTGVGLEVRVGYSVDALFRSQFARKIGTAREIAEEWKQAVIAKGFEEVKRVQ